MISEQKMVIFKEGLKLWDWLFQKIQKEGLLDPSLPRWYLKSCHLPPYLYQNIRDQPSPLRNVILN